MLVKCRNGDVFDILGEVKHIAKINLPASCYFTVTPRKRLMPCVAHVKVLADGAGLERSRFLPGAGSSVG